MRSILSRSIFALSVSGCLALSSLAGQPPAFTDLTLDAALKQIANTDKVLVVKFTAEWCGPCKAMDRTTWKDDKVVEWVKANGVAIQVDVDKEPKIARQYKVNAMPTMVAIKGGKEVARRVGFMNPSQTMTWMQAAHTGAGAESKPEAGAPAGNPDNAVQSMQDRLSAAEELVRNEQYDKALAEFSWLWDNMVQQDPSMLGVRGSFLAASIKDLAEKHEPTRSAFRDKRDAAEKRLKSDERTFTDLDDWVVLNDIIGDSAATLAWVDRVKGDSGAASSLRRVGFRLEPLLIENKRWADLVLLDGDPLVSLAQQHQMTSLLLASVDRAPKDDEMPADMKAQIADMPHKVFRDKAATLYVANLAAGKEDVASSIVARATELSDSPELRIALVDLAVNEGFARPAQQAILEKAGDTDAAKAARDKLAKALKAAR